MPRPHRSRRSRGVRRRRRSWRAALAVASVLAVAGCGGDDAPVRAEGGRLAVELDDFLLRPQAVRAAPGPVALEAVNHGRVGHNLHVRRGERDVIEIATLLPGERGTATGTLRRGEYTLLCTIGNHRVLGMYGTLTVR